MTQFNSPPIKRTGGSVDVYTGLLFVALLVLGIGVALLATNNIEHSGMGRSEGGMLNLVDSR